MPKTIEQAALELDPENINHWTTDGLPRIETLKLLTGDSTITREAINTAAPNLTRDSLAAQLAEDVQANEEPVDNVVIEEFPEKEIESTLVSVRTEITAIQAEITERKAKLDWLVQKEADLDGRLTQNKSKANLNPEIGEYLAAQTKHEEERTQQIQSLRDSGAVELIETLKKLGV